MKLSLKIAKVLERLIKGETIAYSVAKSRLIEDLVFENILLRKGKHRKTISLRTEKGLNNFLANQLQIHNLNQYISALENEQSTRAEFVNITTDSKNSKERAFKGFLVNSYDPIIAELNNKELIINPVAGSFTFIYDYEGFKIPEDVTVVGVENAKNFSCVREQRYLFGNITPLFVSRYPQNQNKDFMKWMKSIPNNYLHFGDFDMAGIGIYLNEYKNYLSDKASFFIPESIKNDIREKGNRNRYDTQRINFNVDSIVEPELLELILTINTEKKGLDQEYYINGDIT
ncbi:hypothetical protein I215_13917 [Galbibacter marinus]|uniref:DUF7281 domain-containing protein n=1 Tax=Galbibacter marinus TaxID=555500 RepID=K2PZW3_9FLAO|nr:hypothetical protein [Galbibacter marinus]EKF54166.1 hypothetical protein I215_13917 [Galbibacter marinus]